MIPVRLTCFAQIIASIFLAVIENVDFESTWVIVCTAYSSTVLLQHLVFVLVANTHDWQYTARQIYSATSDVGIPKVLQTGLIWL